MEEWYTQRGTKFNYNNDFTGDLVIVDSSGNKVVIPTQDVLDLVAWAYVARNYIKKIEHASVDELLLGNPLPLNKNNIDFGN